MQQYILYEVSSNQNVQIKVYILNIWQKFCDWGLQESHVFFPEANSSVFTNSVFVVAL
jgi:hypothetical protein